MTNKEHKKFTRLKKSLQREKWYEGVAIVVLALSFDLYAPLLQIRSAGGINEWQKGLAIIGLFVMLRSKRIK